MKKGLLTFLAVILILGALAGAGYAGYCIGYYQGATSSSNVKFLGPAGRMDPNFAPMPRFNRGFDFRVQPYHPPMMGRVMMGFGFFSPLHFLWNIVVLGLVIWFVYWLFTRSGWKITRQTAENPKVETGKTE